MGMQSAIVADPVINTARETAANMKRAVAANSGARHAEIPLATFSHIADLLATLAERLEASAALIDLADDDATASVAETLTATLALVPLMSGEPLAEQLSPAEIKAIAQAAMTKMTHLNGTSAQGRLDPADPLERLFARYT